MIEFIAALIVSIVTFYVCTLFAVAFARKRAMKHASDNGIRLVNEYHCFWCAFWINAARGISGGE